MTRSTLNPPHGPDNPDPASVLAASLDGLVVTGLLSDERRADASVIAWAAVHGLSCLLVDTAFGGPVAATPEAAVEAVLGGVLRAVLDETTS